MKVEDFNPCMVQCFARNNYRPEKMKSSCKKIVSIKCPKCNNNHLFYCYGKDKDGFKKISML